MIRSFDQSFWYSKGKSDGFFDHPDVAALIIYLWLIVITIEYRSVIMMWLNFVTEVWCQRERRQSTTFPTRYFGL